MNITENHGERRKEAHRHFLKRRMSRNNPAIIVWLWLKTNPFLVCGLVSLDRSYNAYSRNRAVSVSRTGRSRVNTVNKNRLVEMFRVI